jgi:hypothetical protein
MIFTFINDDYEKMMIDEDYYDTSDYVKQQDDSEDHERRFGVKNRF